MLSDLQRELITEILEGGGTFSMKEIFAIADKSITINSLKDEQLIEFLKVANGLYRAGLPIISDKEYDHFIKGLQTRNPEAQYLQDIEPELASKHSMLELPTPMLSTAKAYDFVTIKQWAEEIKLVANNQECHFEKLLFRCTAKLDGFAAYDDGHKLYTRGNGRYGKNITHLFSNGLEVAKKGVRGLGAGEIVIDQNYYNQNLSEHFEYPRNIYAGLFEKRNLNPFINKAVLDTAIVFYPFTLLQSWQGKFDELTKNFKTIINVVLFKIPYPVDGVVVEVVDDAMRRTLGSTKHHHRWQIAFKN